MIRWLLTFAALALAAPALGGCGDPAASPLDAAPPPADGATNQRDSAATHDGGQLVADFVAQGCARLEEWRADGGTPGGDGGAPGADGGVATGTVCVGYAPLTLTFVPLTSGNVESWVWTFGEDGETPLREETPTHTFTRPGSYDVSLTVGGAAGTLAVRHDPPFVQVLANPAGSPCDEAAQCAAGLECACPHAAADDTSCPAAFGGRALCTRECTADADCGPDAVCADLGRGAPWRGPLCLAACDAATVCPGAMSCRELPAPGNGDAWTSACFPAFLGDVGAPCLDVDGAPVPDACVGGVCLALGTSGYCSAACDGGECPAGSACARLGGVGGYPVCLASCDSVSCADDPLLGCEVADPTGALGFDLVDPAVPVGATFCAPRRCGVPADCAGLVCAELDGAGFCQPNP